MQIIRVKKEIMQILQHRALHLLRPVLTRLQYLIHKFTERTSNGSLILYTTKHPCEKLLQSCTNVGSMLSGVQSLTWPATGKMLDI